MISLIREGGKIKNSNWLSNYEIGKVSVHPSVEVQTSTLKCVLINKNPVSLAQCENCANLLSSLLDRNSVKSNEFSTYKITLHCTGCAEKDHTNTVL